MNKDKLKHCPFCYSNEVQLCDEWFELYCIECASCGVLGPLCEIEEEAFNLWNDRRPHPKKKWKYA